jgi:hypothetical protein
MRGEEGDESLTDGTCIRRPSKRKKEEERADFSSGM